MTALKHVFDGTPDNFQQLVIENSHRGTVLVNYWTPNAGPCFKLWQALESLSQEYSGRFLLVNINTDTQGRLARDNGITSVPTVKIYRQGEVVEAIYGAHSETSLRATLDKHVQPEQDPAIAEAIRHYQAGNIEDALGLLAEASRRKPEDVKLYATALKLLLREKRYADLDTCYFALPEAMQAQAELSALQVHGRMLYLAATAADAPQAEAPLQDTPETLVRQAAIAMLQDDFQVALERLLQAFKIDRHYDGEFPRRAMLAIFSLLGDKHELTVGFKKRLQDALH